MVDTLGLIIAVVVHAGDIQDRDGAKLALAKLVGLFPWLKLIWADGGYAGKLTGWTKELGGWLLEIVKRCDNVAGSKVLGEPNTAALGVLRAACRILYIF